jgi:hypothetical protein
MKELGIANLVGNPTYTPTTLAREQILDNHRPVLYSFGISTKDEGLHRPSLYWIPKLHMCPFKQSYVVGSAKCSTKPLSKLLSCILSAVKTVLQSYCDTSYSKGGVNQMWILKNSEDQLEYIQSMQYRSLSSCNSINTFDFSTLYITIAHAKPEDKLRDLIQLCFIKNNGQRSYKYLVLGRDRSYFKKTIKSLKLISSTCSSF